MHPDPVHLLRTHLGYPSFRPGQEELVRAALAGRDTLGVLPTGGGKSVCYQVPTLALGGVTLVLTPLVSLMEDQTERAAAVGLAAAYLSAGQPSALRAATSRRLVAGDLDILFVAPERLELPSFRAALRRAPIRLLAVDEAHCVSEWGDDFRPSYRRIGEIRSHVHCPVMALTATATPRVREQIRHSLRLRAPTTVLESFDRPNLSWSVVRAGPWRRRVAAVHRLLRTTPGTALVYGPTRRVVEATRDALAALGLPTERYHAGLSAAERTRVQGVFMAGACRTVVATNAFGMGIDKADVRLVAHLQLPATLEGYYQEAGRAGRDGAPARCVAFHHPHDRRLGASFIDRSHPPRRVLRRLHRLLRRRADGLGVVGIGHDEVARCMKHRVTEGDVEPMLEALARCGAIRFLPEAAADSEGTVGRAEGSLHCRMGVRGRASLAGAARLRRHARTKLAAVGRYARSRRCRRQTLLSYFGEDAPAYCGTCDRCTVG